MKIMNKLKSVHPSNILNAVKSIKTPLFIKNLYLHHKYVLLAVIIALAIFIFGRVTRTIEGMENSDETITGSYVAPAGNTVLFELDMMGENIKEKEQKQKEQQKQKQKMDKERRKKKHNSAEGPLGILRSQIPDGEEDLYILKSEVIPPVCPACPNVTVCPNAGNGYGNGNGNEPPPCPPCARCPEPSFECKKVPNYNRNDSNYLPRPVLADFSQFGM
jgi:hypothetical protein